MDLKEILCNSSIAGLISEIEIIEIAEEVNVEIKEYLEAEAESIREDYLSEIRRLESDIADTEIKLDCLKHNQILPSDSLEDVMVNEWLRENYDIFKTIYKSNKSGKDVYDMYKYGEYLDNLGKEAAPAVSEMIDEQILQDLIELQDASRKTYSVSSYHKSSHMRIILVGKAASGKDHMRKQLESKGFKYAISYTTRPPRSNEENGKDYIFISKEEFEDMIKDDLFYEHVSFNGWYYGTSKRQFYEDDVFIMTPHGLSLVSPEDRKQSIVFFFDIPYDIRKERLSLRSDADTVDRRLEADEKDFSGFTDFDIHITNENF